MRISSNDHHVVVEVGPKGERIDRFMPGLGSDQPPDEATPAVNLTQVRELRAKAQELANVEQSLAAREKALFLREQALEAAEDKATAPA